MLSSMSRKESHLNSTDGKGTIESNSRTLVKVRTVKVFIWYIYPGNIQTHVTKGVSRGTGVGREIFYISLVSLQPFRKKKTPDRRLFQRIFSFLPFKRKKKQIKVNKKNAWSLVISEATIKTVLSACWVKGKPIFDFHCENYERKFCLAFIDNYRPFKSASFTFWAVTECLFASVKFNQI